MKSRLNRKEVKLRKDEAGYALMWVLILMIAGGIILVPLLLLMTAGLTSSHHHEERMLRFYAADAGIEDGFYKVLNQDANLPPTADNPPYEYTIADVNGNQVTVAIENIWILEGFETESEHQGTTPHEELVTTGHTAEDGVYQIDIAYDGAIGNIKVNRIGVWLPPGFSYVSGTSTAITTLSAPIDDTVDIIPVVSTALFPSQGILYIDNEQIEYSDTGNDQTAFTGCTRGVNGTTPAPHSGGAIISSTLVAGEPTPDDFRDGTAYTWDFDPTVNFNVGDPTPEDPVVHSLSFQFIPPDQEPTWAFSWTRTDRHDIYLSWDLTYGIYRVTATAQEDGSGKETSVTSYVTGPEPWDIMTYTYESY